MCKAGIFTKVKSWGPRYTGPRIAEDKQIDNVMKASGITTHIGKGQHGDAVGRPGFSS